MFRTAHELGMTTVAIYSHEDRFSAHRNKADEAYMVGKGKTPVAAYLAQDDIIKVSQISSSRLLHVLTDRSTSVSQVALEVRTRLRSPKSFAPESR